MMVTTIIGTRPQYVKASAVSRVLRRDTRERLVDTGQHYDDLMATGFARALELPAPDVQLGVGSGPPGAQTARMLEAVERVLSADRPDAVLVYGDTNSTLAGALAAVKLQIPVVHVEAGCRSYDMGMPEEVNRVVVDHLSTVLCCATARNADALAKEGLTRGVAVVGDVMLDVLERHEASLDPAPVLARFGVTDCGYLLLTVHRAANTDDIGALRAIFSALSGSPEPVLFPVHPRTRARLTEAGLTVPPPIREIAPLLYRDMLALASRARLVATDSGGLQKEAFFLGTPCMTLRESTEWTETVDAGWNVIVGADPVRIRAALGFRGGAQPPRRDLFGGGHAAERVAEAIHRLKTGVAA